MSSVQTSPAPVTADGGAGPNGRERSSCSPRLRPDRDRPGVTDSWNVALNIVNMGLISAIMALGVNMQWGYAGLFNVGVMGFVALGGLGAVIVSRCRPRRMPGRRAGWP
jgi:hypothetical protein